MFLIKLDKVITMTETRDVKLIQVYEYYLQDNSNESNKPSPMMGYVSSVEQARKNLENLFKQSKES
jgi:hypothetical protein